MTSGRQICFLAFLMLSAHASSLFAQHKELYKISRPHYLMGTRAQIVLYHHDRDEGQEIIEDAFRIADEVDARLSNWKQDSELSLMNARKDKSTLVVSKMLYQFLHQAKKGFELSKGAFDITISPLQSLWLESGRKNHAPSEAQIQQAKSFTGSQFFTLKKKSKSRFSPPRSPI